MPINIYFGGLICHYGGNPKRGVDRNTKIKSIIINDGAHTPHISINGTSSNVTGNIVFANEGKARVSDTFRSCVPHIEDLTNDTITLDPNAGFEVILPSGELHIAEFFKKGAIFTLGDLVLIQPCIPRFTLLIADEATLTVKVGNEAAKPLKNNDCVLIENASNDVIKTEGDHWKQNVKVTNGGPNDLAVFKALSNKSCKKPIVPGNCAPQLDKWSLDRKKDLEAAASSECANSQWP